MNKKGNKNIGIYIMCCIILLFSYITFNFGFEIILFFIISGLSILDSIIKIKIAKYKKRDK